MLIAMPNNNEQPDFAKTRNAYLLRYYKRLSECFEHAVFQIIIIMSDSINFSDFEVNYVAIGEQ